MSMFLLSFHNLNNTGGYTFKIVIGTLFALSILGAVFLLVTFLIFRDPKIRTFPIKLIMYLSITIIIAFTFYLIFDQPAIAQNSGACFFVGLAMHYGFLANFCWTFCIAFNFYRMIVAQDRDTQAYEKWYHLAAWLLPVIPVAIIAGLRQYGRLSNTNDWVCWIKSPIALLVAFFVPGLLIVSANTILFFFIAREIRDTLKGAADIRGNDKNDNKRQFRVYISIVFSIGLGWIFGFIEMIFLNSKTMIVASIFDILFNIFVPLQGFFLFAAYCINEKIFKNWAELFGKCIPCCATLGRQIEQMSTASKTTNTGKTGDSQKFNSGTSDK